MKDGVRKTAKHARATREGTARRYVDGTGVTASTATRSGVAEVCACYERGERCRAAACRAAMLSVRYARAADVCCAAR